MGYAVITNFLNFAIDINLTKKKKKKDFKIINFVAICMHSTTTYISTK